MITEHKEASAERRLRLKRSPRSCFGEESPEFPSAAADRPSLSGPNQDDHIYLAV